MANKAQQAARRRILEGSAAVPPGAQLLRPGQLPFGIAHHPAPITTPVCTTLPHGDGAVMHVVGGMHPLVWMAGQVVAARTEIGPEEIVVKADKILNECHAFLQRKALAAQAAEEAEADEELKLASDDAPAEAAPSEPAEAGKIITEV